MMCYSLTFKTPIEGGTLVISSWVAGLKPWTVDVGLPSYYLLAAVKRRK